MGNKCCTDSTDKAQFVTETTVNQSSDGMFIDALTEEIRTPALDKTMPLSVVVFGATGDLAKKKLFPALYQLMLFKHFPPHVSIIAYGRKAVVMDEFLGKQCSNCKFKPELPKEEFFGRISFHAGGYDAPESYAELDTKMKKYEAGKSGNRLYFLSIPPTIFGPVCQCIAEKSRAVSGGFTHLIIEKPFGRDSATFETLNATTSSLFKESELFRIDHYLGKEVVLNLTTMRWANQIFEQTWNRNHIASVEITFKEDLGTGGRGGYFDGFGIIRDIMQNHLLQVFMLMAMEPPTSMSTFGIINAKVQLLKAVETLDLSKGVFLGQFTGNTWTTSDGVKHSEKGYLEDETVPKGSKCPTFAATVLRVNNDRWAGVPFLMKAGKGLDERLGEVRVRFKPQAYNKLFGKADPTESNELVMRIQPDEALFLKTTSKQPGLEQITRPTVMEMHYKDEFANMYVGDAYERMFLNAAKGDGSLFVSAAELVEAWRIFTPLLHQIEEQKPDVVLYPFGSRFPPGFDQWSQSNAGIFQEENWKDFLATHANEVAELKQQFQRADNDGKGKVHVSTLAPEIQKTARRLSTTNFNMKEEKKVAQATAGLADKDGMVDLNAFLKAQLQVNRALTVQQHQLDHTGWGD